MSHTDSQTRLSPEVSQFRLMLTQIPLSFFFTAAIPAAAGLLAIEPLIHPVSA